MRGKRVALAAAMAVLGSKGAQAGEDRKTVVVYMANEHIAMRTAPFAKAQAAKMFATIGVQIQWRSRGRVALPDNAIVVEMVEQDSGTDCAGALACAKPFEGTHIRVFYDRLGTRVSKGLVPALLAHVLVHEITHILQRTNRHSDYGVMKAEWDATDFDQMRARMLPFTETDVILIERGLATREAGGSSRTICRAFDSTAREV
jgi:hypothetical protein